MIWTLAICAASPSLLLSLVVPTLADMPDMLHVSVGNASWIVTAPLLSSSVTLPVLSRMADMYGRRRILLVSLWCLLSGSVLASFTSLFPMVVAGRALQGCGSGMVPIAFGIARQSLPRERFHSGVALISGATGVGLALGVPFAGVITNLLGWSAAFWFPGIVGLFLVVAVICSVPSDSSSTRGGFDIVGSVVLGATLVALLVAISYGPSWGWISPRVLALLLVSALGATVWIPRQLGSAAPTVDLRLAMIRPVLMTNLSAGFITLALISNLVVTPLQVTAPEATGYGLGLTGFEAGVLMLPFGLVLLGGAPIAGRLLSRWGAQRVLALGAAVLALSFLVRIAVSTTILGVILTTMIAGVGLAPTLAGIPALILASVPPADSAAASGVNNLVRSIASCLVSPGIAVLVSMASVTVMGEDYLSTVGLHLYFMLAALCSLIAAGLAVLITPLRPRREVSITVPETSADLA